MTLADRLLAVRRGGAAPLGPLAPGEKPGDLAAAYAVAANLAESLGPVAGWKIGATSERGQRMLGIPEPFFGRVLAGTVRQAPATWTTGGRPITLDAEILFEMAETPPPGATPDTLRACVRAVRLGVEVNQPSYADPFAEGGFAIVADNGANAGLVVGPAIPPDTDLPSVTAAIQLDGVTAMEGTGAAVLGDPWTALAWLAGALPRHGLALKPGDLVASGNLCFANARAGQRVDALFGALGGVTLRIA